MIRLRIFFHRLLGLFLRRKLERELEEEIRSHLEMQMEDNLRQGMSLEDARRAARLKFGGVEQVKEAYRDKSRLGWIESLWQDLRYGVRMLLKKPGFTAVAVITLALGIGANAVIFSVVNTALLRPLPFDDPDRLIMIRETKLPEFTDFSVGPATFLDWKNQNTVFERLVAMTDASLTLIGAGDPERLRGMRVTDGFFAMLGARPQIGRDFLPEEDRAGRNNV